MMIRSQAIYTEQGCIDGMIEIRDGKFQKIMSDIQSSDHTINYERFKILPGFIDIHTHGFQGSSAQTIAYDEMIALKRAYPSSGVTGFLATPGAHVTHEYENLSLLANVIDGQTTTTIQGAEILGIHMEGPFLNLKRRGGFQADQLLTVSIMKMQKLIKAARHHIRYISIAPELDPDGTFMQFLKDQKIIISGAHTVATFEEFNLGIAHGMKASTHTGNGMRQMDRRDAGALGAALLNDDLYCEVICDFHHIDPHMLEIMFRIKRNGWQKFIMISDSTAVSGLGAGTYTMEDMQVTVLENGLIYNEEDTIIGSTYGMLDGFRNLLHKMKLPMEDILKMTSLNPARLLRLDDRKGSIKEGKDADFIVLDEKDKLVAVYVNGVCVYPPV